MPKRISIIAAAAVTVLTANTGSASAQDWQGFYVGAHAGSTDGEAVSPWFLRSRRAPDVSGDIYGIQGGYNWELGTHWVVGLEGQATWGDRQGDDGGQRIVEINHEYSIRARGGYLIAPSWLLYGTGGWVSMDVDVADLGTRGSVNESVDGWTYGIGTEARFGPHWSGFVEVRRDEMNQTRFSLPREYDERITPETDSVRVGVNYRFAAAAPPPPPPPPPVVTSPPPPPVAAACPMSEFVVYFEWDRSNLNQAALETIDAAVNRARQCNVSGTIVVGHTDTSGSPTYNQGLSERRASVVRDALVGRGMAAGSITTQARGETDLARATRDGVREPLNRRTAVTISFR